MSLTSLKTKVDFLAFLRQHPAIKMKALADYIEIEPDSEDNVRIMDRGEIVRRGQVVSRVDIDLAIHKAISHILKKQEWAVEQANNISIGRIRQRRPGQPARSTALVSINLWLSMLTAEADPYPLTYDPVARFIVRTRDQLPYILTRLFGLRVDDSPGQSSTLTSRQKQIRYAKKWRRYKRNKARKKMAALFHHALQQAKS